MRGDNEDRVGTTCCCFLNNVRFLVLLLTTIAVSAMYSNLILFNLTSILHTDLHKDELSVPGLDSLNEYSIWHDRKRREIKEVGQSKTAEDDGYPILPPTPAPEPTTTKEATTTKKTVKPQTIFITNPALKVETTTEAVLTTTRIERDLTPDNNKNKDVVAEEVRKTLQKLKEADDIENGRLKNNITKNALQKKESEEEEYVPPPEAMSIRLKRTILYAAPGIGVAIGTCISMTLSRRFGVHIIFSIFLLFAAILTAATPFAAASNYYVLTALRLFQGIIFSIVFPVVGTVLIRWGALKEQLFFITSMILFIALGPLFSWPITMHLHYNEVPLYGIYFVHSAVLVVIALIWLIVYRDQPQNHPWVTGKELNKIVAGKVQELQSNRASSESCPSLLRSLSAWSIWISAFGMFLATAFFAIYLPAFLSSQDVFMVDYLGVYAVVPFILLPATCLLSAVITKFVEPSTKNVRILNTVGFVLASFFILLFPIMFRVGEKNIPLFFLILTMAPFGLSIVCGFTRSLTVVGRVFARQLVSVCAFSFAFAFILMPIIVGFSVKENKIAYWNSVIMILVFILLVSAVEFAVFGRGRLASWAESSWDPLVASTKMQSLALIDFNQDECGLYELRRIEPNK